MFVGVAVGEGGAVWVVVGVVLRVIVGVGGHVGRGEEGVVESV